MDRRNSERDKLERDFKAFEDKIAAASELVALTIRDRDLSLADIARGLPTDSALIDLVQYRQRISPQETINGRSNATCLPDISACAVGD